MGGVVSSNLSAYDGTLLNLEPNLTHGGPSHSDVTAKISSDRALLPSPRSITTAESNEHWTYLAATVDYIRTTLGQRIMDAIECAPTRLRERTTVYTL
jgi:hypothetical protein